MIKQLICAVAFTALCLLLMAIGWLLMARGCLVGGLIWCAALPCGIIGSSWLLSLVINTDGWF